MYRLLDIPPSSSRAQIRNAYIAKIKVMHPDVSADDDATEDAIALNAAYTALMVSFCQKLVLLTFVLSLMLLLYQQCYLHVYCIELLCGSTSACHEAAVLSVATCHTQCATHNMHEVTSDLWLSRSLPTMNYFVQEAHVDYDEEDDLLDVFDITEAEPDLLFINPFGCQVDPLCWRELQVCCAALSAHATNHLLSDDA